MILPLQASFCSAVQQSGSADPAGVGPRLTRFFTLSSFREVSWAPAGRRRPGPCPNAERVTGSGCPGLKMLSLKLPRLFRIDQVPQVCAPVPVVGLQAEARVSCLPGVTVPSSAGWFPVGPLNFNFFFY